MSKLANFRENHLRPGLFIFSLILSTIMLIAADWQWRRYHEKLELVETYKDNKESAELVVTPDQLDSLQINDLLNKKIRIKGHFDFNNQMIVSNRRSETGAGSWLVTPFKFSEEPGNNRAILVSRGFIPYEDRNEDSWKKYDLKNTDSAISVKGILSASTGKRSPLSPSAETKNEKIFLYPDLKLMSKHLPYPIHEDLYLQAIMDPIYNGYPLTDIKIDVPPSTHFWYTFEWIGLAILTQVICFLIQLFRPKHLISRNLDQSSLIPFIFSVLAFVLIGSTTESLATSDTNNLEQRAGIVERLSEEIDLSLIFEKEDGEKVPLSTFFNKGKPVIIAPVYFECPRLCSLTQEGLLKSIISSDLKIGPDYQVLSISFNSLETSKHSSKRAEAYREKFPEKIHSESKAWNFLTGEAEAVEKLMNQLGFNYEFDKGEFMHAAGIIVLTPDGKISRYLYGVEHDPTDFKLALVEASQGKIGSFMNRALMFCFRYDHIKGQYTLAIWRIIRIVCSGFVVFLLAYVYYLKRKEKY